MNLKQLNRYQLRVYQKEQNQKEQKDKDGFIVHPFETGNKKYHASYGNHNKTQRSFLTLKRAKNYLRIHGVVQADYDSPSGIRILSLRKKTSYKKVIRRQPKTNTSFGFGKMDLGFNLGKPKKSKSVWNQNFGW